MRQLLTVALLLGIAIPALATDAFNRPGLYVGLDMAGGMFLDAEYGMPTE